MNVAYAPWLLSTQHIYDPTKKKKASFITWDPAASPAITPREKTSWHLLNQFIQCELNGITVTPLLRLLLLLLGIFMWIRMNISRKSCSQCKLPSGRTNVWHRFLITSKYRATIIRWRVAVSVFYFSFFFFYSLASRTVHNIQMSLTRISRERVPTALSELFVFLYIK